MPTGAYVYPRDTERIRRYIEQSPLKRVELAKHVGCSESRITLLVTREEIAMAVGQAAELERILGAERGSLFVLGGGPRELLVAYLPAPRKPRKRRSEAAA